MLKNGPLCWPQGSFTASSHPVGFLSPLLSKGYDRIAHLITQATPAQVLGAGGQATGPPPPGPQLGHASPRNTSWDKGVTV